MSIKTRAYIFITAALFCGALFPLALEVANTQGISIFAFLFLAFLMAMPASLAFVVARKKTGELKRYLRNPKEFILIGVMGFINLAFVDYGIAYAEKFVSASLATVLYRMQPLLMLLFIPFLLREHISRIQVAALSLAFIGVYIAFSAGGASLFTGVDGGIVLFLVVMTLISAFATVFLKRYNTDMESTMFMFNTVALVIAFGLFMYSGARLPALNLSSIVAISYIGLVANIFMPFFYYSAFRALKTTFVTNLYFLSPFITMLFANIIFGEPIYLYYLVIAALVTVGIFIQRFDRTGGRYVIKNREALAEAPQIADITGAFLNTNVRAISDAIKGSGRVLAMKLDRGLYEGMKERMRLEDMKLMDSLLVYTSHDEHMVGSDESAFIVEALNPSENETVLMSAGDPEASERFFYAVVSGLGGSPAAGLAPEQRSKD